MFEHQTAAWWASGTSSSVAAEPGRWHKHRAKKLLFDTTELDRTDRRGSPGATSTGRENKPTSWRPEPVVGTVADIVAGTVGMVGIAAMHTAGIAVVHTMPPVPAPAKELLSLARSWAFAIGSVVAESVDKQPPAAPKVIHTNHIAPKRW